MPPSNVWPKLRSIKHWVQQRRTYILTYIQEDHQETIRDLPPEPGPREVVTVEG